MKRPGHGGDQTTIQSDTQCEEATYLMPSAERRHPCRRRHGHKPQITDSEQRLNASLGGINWLEELSRQSTLKMRISSSRNIQWNRKRRRLPLSSPVSAFILLCLSLSLPLAFADTSDSWIDPDTPKHAHTTKRYNIRLGPANPTPKTTTAPHKRRKPTISPAPTISVQPSHSPSSSPTQFPTFDSSRNFELVFSDEFNTPFRTFDDGHDPRWTALDKNDYTNDALHYYSPKNAYTNEQGELVIESHAADTHIVGFDDVKLKKTRVTKHFTSAMLQSWNKFCFTGGIIEANVQLPGKSQVGGLWPAFWLLGNLARHTYVGSSQHIWPWSSLVCTEKSGYAQQISGCDAVAHYGE